MKRTILITGLGLIIIITALLVMRGRSQAPTTSTAAVSGCVSQSFTVGSEGHCVSDIQTMANFMQTDNLTQCPFTGGKVIVADGHYTAETQAQVTVIQNWFNCYNKEEGETTTVTADGTVTPATWHSLCSYAYRFPSSAPSSPSPYRSQSLASGKDANCQ